MSNQPKLKLNSFIAYRVQAGLVETLHDQIDALAITSTEQAIAELEPAEPQGSQWSAIGVAPVHENRFALHVGDGVALNVRFSERVLPASVIKKALNERIDHYTELEGRRPGKKFIMDLKDQVVGELLPQAFVKVSYVTCLFRRSREHGDLLFIFTSSHKKADSVLSVLSVAMNAAVGTALNASPVTTQRHIPLALTALAKDALHVFEDNSPNYEHVLEASSNALLHGAEKRRIRIKDRDVAGDEIQALLNDGYTVHDLAMTLGHAGDVLADFTVNEHLVFKRFVLDRIKGERSSEQDLVATMLLISRTAQKALEAVVELAGGVSPASNNDVEKPSAAGKTQSAAPFDDDEEF